MYKSIVCFIFVFKLTKRSLKSIPYQILFIDSRIRIVYSNAHLSKLMSPASLISFQSTSSYAVTLNAEDWWVIVLQYKQPKYPMFAVEMTLTGRDGSTNHFIDVEYCPSHIGCRVKAVVYAKEGELSAVLKRPRNRDFIIVSIVIFKSLKVLRIMCFHLIQICCESTSKMA